MVMGEAWHKASRIQAQLQVEPNQLIVHLSDHTSHRGMTVDKNMSNETFKIN